MIKKRGNNNYDNDTKRPDDCSRSSRNHAYKIFAVHPLPGRQNSPACITYLGKVLPYAVIGMLVIYCLKDSFSNGSYAFPEVTAGIFTIMLHKWRKNTLLSIGAGTVLYMFLIQNYF